MFDSASPPFNEKNTLNPERFRDLLAVATGDVKKDE